jgi:hypothetical protein
VAVSAVAAGECLGEAIASTIPEVA